MRWKFLLVRLLARLFAGAGRVRYAWRPAATRAGGSELVATARPPLRIARRGVGLWLMGLREDKKTGLWFQTGVTTGLTDKPKTSNAIGS